MLQSQIGQKIQSGTAQADDYLRFIPGVSTVLEVTDGTQATGEALVDKRYTDAAAAAILTGSAIITGKSGKTAKTAKAVPGPLKPTLATKADAGEHWALNQATQLDKLLNQKSGSKAQAPAAMAKAPEAPVVAKTPASASAKAPTTEPPKAPVAKAPAVGENGAQIAKAKTPAGNAGRVKQGVAESDLGPVTQEFRKDNAIETLKLKTELSLKDAGILTADGGLTDAAVQNSRIINLGSRGISNPDVIRILTKDGSEIQDWQKFTTQSVSGPNGSSIQVHFYKNIKTGKIDYATPDFKVKNPVPAVPKSLQHEPMVSPGE